VGEEVAIFQQTMQICNKILTHS